MSRLIDADVLKRKAQKEATEAWKMKITAKVETILNQFIDWIDKAPTIEPERGSCETCKRASSYCCKSEEDVTRCPIEEHYRLPRDGYCHLWERRNVTDDDYPERRTDE